MNKQLIFFIVLILVSSSVLSIGISPSTANLNFKSERTETINLKVHNTCKEECKISVISSGDLSKYITLPKTELTLNSEELYGFSYIIKLPKELEPGIHVGEIKFKKQIQSEGTLAPSVVVVHNIFVHVPYPGKYIEGKIKSTNAKLGEDIFFYIKLFNLGEEDLSSVHARLDIFENNELINRLTTESKPLPTKQSGELIVSLPSDGLTPGNYNVNATIFFDDKEIELQTSFIVQSFLIDLISFSADDFTLGGISKFSILLKNKGNRPVKNIKTNILFEDKNSELVASFSGFELDLKPEETKETKAYWDTSPIEAGKYFGTISISYEDQLMEKEFTSFIDSENIDIMMYNPTGKAITEQPSSSSLNLKLSLNTALLLILVTVSITILIILFKRKGK